MGVRDVVERDSDLAGAARLVDFLVDEAELAADRALDARQLQFRRHADGEPGQRLFGHVGFEIDRSVLDDAEKRLARGHGVGAEPGRAPADHARNGRLHLRPVDAHEELLPLRVAALAIGLGDAERVPGRRELGLSGLHRGLALLDGRDRHHAAFQFARALEIVVGELKLRLRLRDQALRLVYRRIGAFGRRVVLGHERVELGAIETGEHLAFASRDRRPRRRPRRSTTRRCGPRPGLPRARPGFRRRTADRRIRV